MITEKENKKLRLALEKDSQKLETRELKQCHRTLIRKMNLLIG